MQYKLIRYNNPAYYSYLNESKSDEILSKVGDIARKVDDRFQYGIGSVRLASKELPGRLWSTIKDKTTKFNTKLNNKLDQHVGSKIRHARKALPEFLSSKIKAIGSKIKIGSKEFWNAILTMCLKYLNSLKELIIRLVKYAREHKRKSAEYVFWFGSAQCTFSTMCTVLILILRYVFSSPDYAATLMSVFKCSAYAGVGISVAVLLVASSVLSARFIYDKSKEIYTNLRNRKRSSNLNQNENENANENFSKEIEKLIRNDFGNLKQTLNSRKHILKKEYPSYKNDIIETFTNTTSNLLKIAYKNLDSSAKYMPEDKRAELEQIIQDLKSEMLSNL